MMIDNGWNFTYIQQNPQLIMVNKWIVAAFISRLILNKDVFYIDNLTMLTVEKKSFKII